MGIQVVHLYNISIHALREEGDVDRFTSNDSTFIFLSTPSARRATISAPPHSTSSGISIHALREEGDSRSQKKKKKR